MSAKSVRMSGSPPEMIIITWCGLTWGVIVSMTRRKSSAGISGVVADEVQSLPQCRQCTLQRSVDSQNSCCRGCSCCKLWRRSRSSSNAMRCRRVISVRLMSCRRCKGTFLSLYTQGAITNLRFYGAVGAIFTRSSLDILSMLSRYSLCKTSMKNNIN